MDEINLQLILKGCLAKNENSQLHLYRHFFGYGMSVSLRYANNKEEAEEILDDAFLLVFAKIEQYDSSYPFKGWFRRIVINASVDYYRTHHKIYKALQVVHKIEFEETTQNIAWEQLKYADLLKVVQQLPPAMRLVFNLYAIEGFKHHEIAAQLEISVGASKSNYSKARKRLMELLPSMSISLHHLQTLNYE